MCPSVEFKANLCIGYNWPLKGDIEFCNWTIELMFTSKFEFGLIVLKLGDNGKDVSMLFATKIEFMLATNWHWSFCKLLLAK